VAGKRRKGTSKWRENALSYISLTKGRERDLFRREKAVGTSKKRGRGIQKRKEEKKGGKWIKLGRHESLRFNECYNDFRKGTKLGLQQRLTMKQGRVQGRQRNKGRSGSGLCPAVEVLFNELKKKHATAMVRGNQAHCIKGHTTNAWSNRRKSKKKKKSDASGATRDWVWWKRGKQRKKR